MPGPACAIAVVSWNTRELLDRCLTSIGPDSEAGRAEVWVVDNASGDGSAELVAERHPWARLIASEENLGFGRAVNRVARETATPWIACANADIALEPGTLAALLGAGEAHAEAGAVAPRLILPDGSTQHSVHPFPTLPFTLAFNAGIARLAGDRLTLEGSWNPARSRFVDWALGAFLLVRRRAWDDLGGFDELQWMYAEDLDLGWRLRQAGWRTWYEPRARVLHESAAATSQAFGSELTARWLASTYEWLARRQGPGQARATGAINAGGAAARAALLAPLARVAPARYGWRRARQREWASLHRAGTRAIR